MRFRRSSLSPDLAPTADASGDPSKSICWAGVAFGGAQLRHHLGRQFATNGEESRAPTALLHNRAIGVARTCPRGLDAHVEHNALGGAADRDESGREASRAEIAPLIAVILLDIRHRDRGDRITIERKRIAGVQATCPHQCAAARPRAAAFLVRVAPERDEHRQAQDELPHAIDGARHPRDVRPRRLTGRASTRALDPPRRSRASRPASGS